MSWGTATEDEPGPDARWIYLGQSSVNGSINRIKVPDGVFDAGILARPGESPERTTGSDEGNDGPRAHFSYESVAGTLILSGDELTNQPRFKWIGASYVGGAEDAHRTTIPREFFPDAGELAQVPDKARVEYGEERHFVTRTAMVDHDPSSCYLVRRERLGRMIGELDDLAEAYAPVPSFVG